MLLRDDRDDGAAIGPPVDEPHGAELAERFADRRARHLEAPGERHLVQLLAGPQRRR